MTIGEDIKKYRKNEGMTQEEMTVRLGVNKWEKGGASYMRTMYSRSVAMLGQSKNALKMVQEKKPP